MYYPGNLSNELEMQTLHLTSEQPFVSLLLDVGEIRNTIADLSVRTCRIREFVCLVDLDSISWKCGENSSIRQMQLFVAPPFSEKSDEMMKPCSVTINRGTTITQKWKYKQGWALGCVNLPPKKEGVRRRDSRNLGPTF